MLLADDHPILLEGLITLLQREFSLAGTATDGAPLIEAARRLKPDVIVTDLAMPGMSGLEALHRLKADKIPAKVIFLTMHADAQLAAEALRAGASGFVVKHAAGKALVAALHEVLRGGTYVTPPLSSEVLPRLGDHGPAGADSLTTRQREVVSLLAAGRTARGGGRPRTFAPHRGDAQVPDRETLGLRPPPI